MVRQRGGRRANPRARTPVRTSPKGATNFDNTIYKRTLRYSFQVNIDNETSWYKYYSTFVQFQPHLSHSWNDVRNAYELYKVVRGRAFIATAFQANQSSNYINNFIGMNAATTVWTAADLCNNETISGVQIMDYNNAKFHIPSLTNYKKICDTIVRFDDVNASHLVLPGSTWLDTGVGDAYGNFNGFQLFIKLATTDSISQVYRPTFNIIIEMDIHFKQPSFQNIASTFTQKFIGSYYITPNSTPPNKFTIQSTKHDSNGFFYSLKDSFGILSNHPIADLYQVIDTKVDASGEDAFYDGPAVPRSF